jgi:hypothetical protein
MGSLRQFKDFVTSCRNVRSRPPVWRLVLEKRLHLPIRAKLDDASLGAFLSSSKHRI